MSDISQDSSFQLYSWGLHCCEGRTVKEVLCDVKAEEMAFLVWLYHIHMQQMILTQLRICLSNKMCWFLQRETMQVDLKSELESILLPSSDTR